jgi:NADH-quinone oxidoreductase subunit D
MLRSAGYLYDLRLSTNETYALYKNITFKSFIGLSGDCFDRFLIRSRELFESTQIIYQCISKLNLNFLNLNIVLMNISSNTQFQQATQNYKTVMETLILKFKNVVDGVTTVNGLNYKGVESGKGEFGVFILITSDNKIYRTHLRSPAYNHLQLTPLMCIGHMFADLVTILGSIDVVFGEVDR